MRRIGLVAALVGVTTLASAQPTGTLPPPSAGTPPAAAPPATPPPTEPQAAPPPASTPTASPTAPAAPAPAPAPSYGYAPPAEPPPAPPPQPRSRTGLVGVLRFAVPVGGSGEVESECSGACSTFNSETADFDEASSMALGGDLLFHLSPQFRLGGGLQYVLGTAVEIDGNSGETDFGNDLSVVAVAEGVLDVGPTTALTVRGQAGLITLFPGGDVEDAIDEMETACSNATIGSCDVDDGPYPGFTLGGGPGLRIALEKVALRADLLVQWYSVKNLSRAQMSVGSEEVDMSVTWTGLRYLLAAGIEF